MKRFVLAALILALPLPALSQEKEADEITVRKTAAGAVFEEKVGIDGSLVSESHTLTRLTCETGKPDIGVLLPVSRAEAGQAKGTTLRKAKDGWRLTLEVRGRKVEKPVTFVAIPDKASQFGEGALVVVKHGDAVWSALIDREGDKLMSLAGDFSAYHSVTDGKALRSFEKLCGLRR